MHLPGFSAGSYISKQNSQLFIASQYYNIKCAPPIYVRLLHVSYTASYIKVVHVEIYFAK